MKIHLVKIVAMTAFACMVSVQVQSQSWDNLYVYSPDGTSQTFALNDLKITFTEQGINLLPGAGNATALTFDNVSVITFKSKPTSGIAVKSTDVKLYLESDKVIIESDTEISAVKLYNLQGQLLVHQTLQPSLTATIPLSSCPAGVYIIQIFGQKTSVHKFIKQ